MQRFLCRFRFQSFPLWQVRGGREGLERLAPEPTSKDAGRFGSSALFFGGTKRAALIGKIAEWSEAEWSNFDYLLLGDFF